MSKMDLDWLKVDQNEDFNAFEWSAKVCILREALLEDLAAVNRRINRTYLDDAAFYENSFNHHKKKRELVFYVILIGAAIAATLLFGSVVGSEDLMFLLSAAAAAAVGYIIKRKDNSDARAIAEQALAHHQAERKDYQQHVAQWREERDELTGSIAKCNDVLAILCRNPQAIPEKYWPIASLLWRYVEDHRADTLKEALALYHEDEHRRVQLAQMQSISQQNAALRSEVSSLGQQLDSIEGRIADAELNNSLNTLLTIAAIYDNRN